MEAKERFYSVDKSRLSYYTNERMGGFDYMQSDFFRDNPKREYFISFHENAKFAKGQSDDDFIEKLAPYIRKCGYMDRMGELFATKEFFVEYLSLNEEQLRDIHEDPNYPENEYNLIGEKLIETHHVEMLV